MNQGNERKLWGIMLASGEGTRARAFLKRVYGGRGIKQFCAVVGRRSMLEHTLARVERLIPRERILVYAPLFAGLRKDARGQLPLRGMRAPGVLATRPTGTGSRLE